ncbi:MAG: hypothetical protein IJX88_05010 [Clostridia bacterium]|nr:hypothetical protein [Clostridia bacterium]
MKMRKKYWALGVGAIALSAAIAPTVSAVNAKAGSSIDPRVFTESFAGETINSGQWKNIGSVQNDDGKLILNEDCEETATLISKNKIFDNTEWGLDTFIMMDSVLQISSIASGAKFSYSFGVQSMFGSIDEEYTLEIKFEDKDGNLCLGVVDHRPSGAVTLVESTPFAGLSYESDITLTGNISTGKKLDLYLGDTIVCEDAVLEELPIGYFALGQKGGKNAVTITELNVDSYDYTSPKNTGDYFEKFDNNEYNSNIWYSNAWIGALSPSGVFVKDGVLRFENTGRAHFTTRYLYSNFELTFDWLDFLNEPEYADDGTLIRGCSTGLNVWFGVPSIKQEISETIKLTSTAFAIGGYGDGADNTVYAKKNYSVSNKPWGTAAGTPVKVPMANTGVDPWDAELTAGRTINVKVLMKDMKLQAWVKYEDQEEFGDPVVEFTYNETPTGYVRIGMYASGSLAEDGLGKTAMGNFSIDNVSIKNMDAENVKQIVSVDFKSNVVAPPVDFEYTDRDDPADLLGNKLAGGNTQEESSCSGSIGGVATLTVTVMALGAAVIKRRNKR